jgi:hypothetical protein
MRSTATNSGGTDRMSNAREALSDDATEVCLAEVPG